MNAMDEGRFVAQKRNNNQKVQNVHEPGGIWNWNLRKRGPQKHALKHVTIGTKLKKLRGLSPRANYTDRAAAAGRRS